MTDTHPPRTLRRAVVAAVTLATVGALTVAATASRQATLAGPAYKKVGSFGKQGTANGQFTGNAFGLAAAPTGDVYVADSDGHRIQRFSPTGAFKGKIAFEQQYSVSDVAVAPDGTVWGTAQQANEARQFSASGGALGTATTPKLAQGVAVDADGNVLVATYGDNIASVVRFDKASDFALGKTIGGFKTPHDVEVASDGSIWVSDNAALAVKRFDAAGRLQKTIKAGPAAPLGIGVDLDCNVWVTNISQRRVDRISPAGKLLGSATAGDLIAQDIAIGPKGDLYVYDSGAKSVIRFAEDRSKAQAAAVSGVAVAKKGAGLVARVTFTLPGVACPAQIAATASLSGAVTGKAAVKVTAGRSTVLSIPVRGKSGKAQFKVVLKTNGRPTTQVALITVNVPA